MSSMQQVQTELIQEFTSKPNWEEKYRHIINLGKSLPSMSDELKIEDNLVKGCQSQVWLLAEPNENHVIRLQADSDALLVKGLISIILRVYDDRTPDEILHNDPLFLKEIGLFNNLSASRANGLQSILKKIHYYALGYQALFEKSRH